MNVSQRTITTAIVIVVAAGLLGCAHKVEGRYSYSTNTDFSALKSFALVGVTDDVFSTPEGTAHFRKTLVSGLSAKGFTEDQENPDFVLHVAPVHTYREIYALHGNIEIPKAMVRVSFVLPGDERNIFESAASTYYEASWTQEEKNLRIHEAVVVILAEFPPNM
jgi:hypothetical protein